MAIYSLAISLTVVLLLTAPAVIDCQWNFVLQPAGHFNSHRDHNLGGSAAYQGEKNSFMIGAHSSAHPNGAENQAFNGAFATTNNDGSNFQIRGGMQDSSFGPGYKQHTESLGTSYTTPGGVMFDLQHSQMNDNFGNKGHNLGGAAAYQGEKNSFMIGAQSSVHLNGAETQALNGAFATKNNDGSNFQIRGRVQDSIFGPGYKQHTESLGTSYTTPGGINVDVQHSQIKDSLGNKKENDQVGVSHTFPSGLKVKADYFQSRDNNGHKDKGVGATVEIPL